MKKIDEFIEEIKKLYDKYGDEIDMTIVAGERDNNGKFIISSACAVCDAEVVLEEHQTGRLKHFKDESGSPEEKRVLH